MFKKATNFLKRTAKKAITSERLKTMALMLVVGTGIAMAQNSAGDYSAGTTALTTVTEEIAKYVPIVVKLCYAIAGVVAVVGAISVYIAFHSIPDNRCRRSPDSNSSTFLYIHRVRYGVTIIHTAALFRCSTGKQQILGYGSFSCINVSKNS